MKAPEIAGLEVLSELPRTGIWETWRVRQTSLDRLVVLKILPGAIASALPDDREFMETTGRVAGITHSNFVQIYDFRKADGEYRLVMEYVPGQNLSAWVEKSGRLPLPTALAVVGSIARVMKFAWDKLGIIHGALKPHNILIDSDNIIKVADFGLSRHFQWLPAVADAAPPGVHAVAPNYLPPEQCRPDGALDCRADIYALGAMLYEMLTGSVPFGSMPAEEIMRRQVEGQAQIPNPKELNQDIPIEVSFLIEKLMIREPNARPQDWNDVCRDIDRVSAGELPEPELAQPGSSIVAYEVKARPKPPPTVIAEEPAAASAPPQKSSVFLPTPAWHSGIPELLKRPALLGAAAAVIVILALVFTLNATKSSHKTHPKSPHQRAPAAKKTAPRSSTAASRSKPVVEEPFQNVLIDVEGEARRAKNAEELAEAQRLLQETKEWAQANPEYYDEIIGRFQLITRIAPNSAQALESLEYIKQVRKQRDAGVRETLATLKKAAQKFIDADKIKEAIAVFEDYNGAFAAETAEDRQYEAAALRRIIENKRAREREEAARAQRIAAESKKTYRAAVSNAVAALFKGAAAEAVQVAERLARNQSLDDATQAEAKALCVSLTEYAGIEQRIMGTFRDQIGKEINLETATGIEKVMVLNVQGDVVDVEKRILLGEGEIRQPKSIKIADLTAMEKRRRLPQENSQATAMAIGLLALQAGDVASARAQFEKFKTPVGAALLEALDNRQAQKLEEAAKQALIRILKATRIAMPETDRWVDVCTEALLHGTFTQREANDFKAAAEEFRRRYPKTHILKEVTPILDALSNLKVGAAEWQQDVSAQPQAQPSQAPEPLPIPTFTSVAADPAMMPARPGFANTTAAAEPHAAMPAMSEELVGVIMEQIKKVNPGFGDWQIKMEVDPDAQTASLEITSILLKDIAPLANAKGITRLLCRGADPNNRFQDQIAAPLRDLSPLKNMRLNELDVSTTSVKDISCLRGMPIRTLDISWTAVDNIGALAGMPLERLRCNSAPIRDLSALAGMSLGMLLANDSEIRDLAPLKGVPLAILEIRQTKVRDLAPLAGMPLNRIDISGTSVKSIEPLRGMELEALRISNTDVKDISPLTGMPLSDFWASGTGIKDIRPLAGMPLRSLRLAGLDIKDISPLQGMALRDLDISNTKVKDLSPLQGMTTLKRLFLQGTDIKSLEPIRDLPIETIFIDRQEAHRNVLQSMPALKRINMW